MTAPAKIATLNVSVEQIESDLRHGRSIQQVAQDWSEPVANVLAVKRAMHAAGERFAAPPKPPAAAPAATGPRPATSAPTNPTTVSSAALSVEALVAAASRSASKRTQQLGVKLDDLALQLRGRLAAERQAAEAAKAEKAVRDRARAEVARLEAQLREARAKAGLAGRRGGSGSVQRDKKPSTPGSLICGQGCGRTFANAQGRGKHEKSCGGAA